MSRRVIACGYPPEAEEPVLKATLVSGPACLYLQPGQLGVGKGIGLSYQFRLAQRASSASQRYAEPLAVSFEDEQLFVTSA